MTGKFLMLCCTLLWISAAAALPESYRVLRHGKVTPENGPVAFENGRFEMRIPFSGKTGDFQLVREMTLDPEKEYLVRFRIENENPGPLLVSYRTKKEPKRNLGLARRVELPAGGGVQEFVFSPGELPKPGETSEFCFQMGGLSGRVALSDISIAELAPVPAKLGSAWTIFFHEPEAFSSVPASPDNVVNIPFDPTPGKVHRIDFASLTGKAGEGKGAAVFTEFDAPEDALVRMGFSADWYMEIFLNGKSIYSTLKQGNGGDSFVPGDHSVLLPVRKGHNVLAVRVRSGSGGWKLVWGVPEKPIRYVAGKEWKAVDTGSIHIRAGSALDLSGMIDAPAGKFGRAVIGGNGLLEFERQPGKPVRLHGFTSAIPDEIWRNCSDKEFRANATRFAKAARRQGYNLFRMHGLDRWVMLDSPNDMEPSEKYLDRWDYLIGELKKEGIYVQFVVFSFNLYSRGSDYDATFRKRNMHKMRLYMGGEFEKERFRRGATALLEHVNPYTKLAWKDDPAIVLVEYYNEEYLGMARYEEAAKLFPEDHKFVLGVWNGWLARRYASIPREKWPELLRKSGIGDIGIPGRNSPLINDYSIFCYERIKETNHWCESVIRAAGYQGLTTENSALQLNSAAAGWETLQVVDNHVYYCHPSNWANPGSLVRQSSAVGAAAGYFRSLAAGKLAGRPQFVGEFNYCFWNPYQHEAALVFNAYAAYQNFSSIAIHSHPVLAKGGTFTIGNFSSGSNPVLRAAQFLSNMLFLRGDVTPSPSLVALSVPQQFLETGGNGMRAVSGEQTRIALMSGFALAFPWAPTPRGITPGRKPDLTVLPAGASEIETHGWYTSVIENSGPEFSLSDAVREMKKRGILPENNLSDPDNGVFQSDTGEITMRTKEKLLKVVTARTEAVSMLAGRGEALGALTVKHTGSDACIGVTSLDNVPLSGSRRMVLVYSTEMVNTGMEVSPGRATLVKLGRGPGLMRTGTLEASLSNRNASGWKLYALSIVGARTEELPVAYRDGKLEIRFDTSELANGNTPFFELVCE